MSKYNDFGTLFRDSSLEIDSGYEIENGQLSYALAKPFPESLKEIQPVEEFRIDLFTLENEIHILKPENLNNVTIRMDSGGELSLNFFNWSYECEIDLKEIEIDRFK